MPYLDPKKEDRKKALRQLAESMSELEFLAAYSIYNGFYKEKHPSREVSDKRKREIANTLKIPMVLRENSMGVPKMQYTWGAVDDLISLAHQLLLQKRLAKALNIDELLPGIHFMLKFENDLYKEVTITKVNDSGTISVKEKEGGKTKVVDLRKADIALPVDIRIIKGE